MNREAFEQLVSDWLDEPQRDDLRQAIDVAVAESSELRRLRDHYIRVHELTLGATRPSMSVDWNRFRSKITTTATVDAESDTPAPLDQALEILPSIDEQVDWERFRQRTSARITGGGAESVSRRIYWRVPLIVGSVGIAAALLLLMFNAPQPMTPTPTTGGGLARALITPAGGGAQLASVGVAQATVTVLDEAASPAQINQAHIDNDSIVFVFTAPPSPSRPTSEPDLVGFY